MQFPGRLPSETVVEAVSGSVDVMPTILDLVGVSVPTTVEGRSLLPLALGQESGEDRFAVAELADRSIATLVTREWQLLKDNFSGYLRLYRLTDAPLYQQDLSAVERETAIELERRLDQWQQAHP
jgi:arylsulfatase A-like enzyme